MELSLTWEAATRLANQEFPNILWNTNVRYCVHTGPYPEPDESNLYQPILFLQDLF
jgi:hypothetical protein